LSRPLVVAALLFTLLFMLAIIAVRAQPYDDSELRALVMPKDCPMPCFMGIRPGVTTMNEAIAILEASEWVDVVDTVTGNPYYVFWTWSGSQPSFINPESEGTLLDDKGIVGYVDVQTNFPIGFALLHLGESYLTDSGATMSGVLVREEYTDRYLEIFAFLECPVTRAHFVNAPMRVSFLSPQIMSGMTGFSDIRFFC
jgi:hypothetical protein